MCAFRKALLNKVLAVFGEEMAITCSWVMCETGQFPSPGGVPSTVDSIPSPSPAVQRCLKAIEWFVQDHYSHRDDDVSLSIPKKSTIGYPYYSTKEDGLYMRSAYLQSYQEHINEIRDLCAEKKWVQLGTTGANGRLPMNAMMSVNYRTQPMQAREIKHNRSGITHLGYKQRKVMDAASQFRVMDTRLDYDDLCQTMRARAINQCAGTIGMLLQGNEVGYRHSYYTRNAIYKAPDIPARVKQFRQQFSDIEDFAFASFDFGGCEKSQDHLVYSHYLAGMRKANVSEAMINLVEYVHYSPYLLTDDDPKRAQPLPTSLHGQLCKPSVLNDLGKRSGEHDTDDGNKDVCMGIYAEGVFEVGGFGERAKHHRTFDSFMEEFGSKYVMQGIRVPGAHWAIGLNCADDCLQGGERKYRYALAEWYKGLAPQFDIQIEYDTQYLGFMVKDDGTCYPYPGKFFSNMFSPERPWTSPMRVDNFSLGIFARLQHHASSPYYPELLRIMNETTLEFWGTTVEAIAENYVPKNLVGTPLNMADMLYLHDPTSLQWGRISAEDVSPQILKAVDYYLNAPPETVSRILL